jgi:alpha-glucosidase
VGADLDLLDTPAGVLGYRRALDTDIATVLVNFTDQPVGVEGLVGLGDVTVASDGAGEGAPFTGTLAPDQAVILGGP